MLIQTHCIENEKYKTIQPGREVFGWHPYWMGNSWKNYPFELLSTVSFFSYKVDPNTGSYTNPDELKIEIQRRLEVQNKLIAYMMEAQNFIKEGGTVNGFLELKYDEQKAKEKAQQNGGATTPPSNIYNPSNALTINTQKEFDALPSGTTYVDGKTGFIGTKK